MSHKILQTLFDKDNDHQNFVQLKDTKIKNQLPIFERFWQQLIDSSLD